MDFNKRVTLFLGHYGSGKTNLAVNYALWLKETGKKTTVYDLDIVNPYFRTLDAKDVFDKHGIEIVASDWANSSLDLPSINPATRGIIDNKLKYAVVDIGGDDRGAYALGRYEEGILAENDYQMFMVVNKYRPETRTIKDIMQVKEEIESACRMKFTAFINNSNLGVETTKQTLLDSLDFVEKLERESGLKCVATTCVEEVYNEFSNEIENLKKIDLIKYGNW